MKLILFDDSTNNFTKTIPTTLYLQTDCTRDYHWSWACV